jgi:hypothetical protein
MCFVSLLALVLALAELHEVVVVQAEYGDAAMLRLLHDGRRRGPEEMVGADVLELDDDALEIDALGLALEDGVDDLDGALAGRRAGLFHPVAEDDLIDAGSVGVDGLAVAHIHAGDDLQLQSEMLDDVAEEGALAHAAHEAAAFVFGAAVLL